MLCFTWLVSACVPGGEQWRIRPDEKLLAGRDAWNKTPHEKAARPLNVVLLVADDLGRSDVSTYGAPGPRISTPGIDALAQQGVAFEAGYVTSPLCSPSRAGLLTGRYQQRFGHEGQPHERYAKNQLEYFAFKNFIARGDWQLHRPVAPDAEDVQRQGLPVAELTLAELLRHQGYVNGAFGKWHLGWNRDFQPLQRGFDEHYGFYEAYSLYADPAREDIVNVRHDDFSERFIWGKGRSGTAAIRRGDKVVDEPEYLTDRITDEAISFIERHRSGPFFAYVAFSAPHTPFQVKREDLAKYADEPDENRRVYLALIASLDAAVARITKAVDDLGLGDDTLIVFLSDNGGALYTGATSNAPLAGGKFTMLEGGLRVPFVMRWPGRIPSGLVYPHPVSALDLVPTVAAATGLQLPGDRAYDGVDLLPYLELAKAGAPHRELFWRAEYTAAVRSGDLKLVRDRKAGVELLFDLAADPGETRDLSVERPDDRRELERALDGFEAQCRDPLWPHIMEYRHALPDGGALWYPL